MNSKFITQSLDFILKTFIDLSPTDISFDLWIL